jgi:glycosyltransferase involved in cell wall biosynthesis
MKYLLSIIIPTRNNQKYLLETVYQVLNNTTENIQVVVQDNSDVDSLKKTPLLNQCRVKYNFECQRLSIVNNFSKGIAIADGEYVMAIGDDDGVLPDINKSLNFMKENNIDALVPSISLEYFWPRSVEIKGKSDGVMRLLKQKETCKKVDGKKEVIKLLKQGGLDYHTLRLAKLYHGIVKKDVLEEISKMKGGYIGGLVPDIYTAVAISLVAKSIYFLSKPLTIAGVSPSSGSSQASNGLHVGSYEEAPQLIGRDVEYSWSSKVPKFYSVETIWGDSALAAIKDLDYTHLVKHFSVEKLIGRLIYKYPEYHTIINKCYSTNIENKSRICSLFSYIVVKTFPARYLIFKAMNRMKRINKKLVFHSGIKCINDVKNCM